MKRIILLAVLGIALFPMPASAHHINANDARSRWYYVFNDHCGNGTLWVCRDRNTDGDSWHGIVAIPFGEHSYSMTYHFREEYIPTGNQRDCTIKGTLTHTTVGQWTETCNG